MATEKSRAQFLEQQIRRFISSGLSGQAFCASQGLSPSSFYHWRRRLQSETSGGAKRSAARTITLPVLEVKSERESANARSVRIERGGVCVIVDAGAAPEWVAALVAALLASVVREGSC